MGDLHLDGDFFIKFFIMAVKIQDHLLLETRTKTIFS